MRRLVSIVAAVAVCAVLAECRRPSAKRESGSAPAPLIAVVARFRPPADGLVTNSQLDRYMRVRRAARGRSDDETARAMDVDPEELAWVRARIVEALVFLDTSQVRSAAETTYARTIASLREAARSEMDRETLRRLEEQIAGLEREKASLKASEPPPPAVAANARRVAPRRAELEAVRP